MASAPDGRVLDLFHVIATLNEDALQQLRSQAQEANVTLHLHRTPDVRLNADMVCQLLPEWRGADIWFCGPPAFGQKLRADFLSRGLAGADFHQELFHMR